MASSDSSTATLRKVTAAARFVNIFSFSTLLLDRWEKPVRTLPTAFNLAKCYSECQAGNRSSCTPMPENGVVPDENESQPLREYGNR